MGITFGSIERMEKLGLFGDGRIAVLDIGSSNLYSAESKNIELFLEKYASREMPDIKEFAQRLAKGSGYDPVRGGLNESFVGELFEQAGMEYLAFDIADGYRTQILDLNHALLPKNLRNHFDLVLNFGTTEHILNQYNCFKIIHDATRLGGYIHHSLPGMGYVDHGYVTYTCRCLFDIAGYNEYEVVDFWFDGPSGRNDPLQGLRSYSGYFPALKRALDEIEGSSQGAVFKAAALPDVGINIVCRKVKDKPFWGALESSTSVGVIPGAVTAAYHGSTGIARDVNPASLSDVMSTKQTSKLISPSPFKQRIASALRNYPPIYDIAQSVFHAIRGKSTRLDAATKDALPNEEETVLSDRLLAGKATLDEGLRLYTLVTARGGTFPLAWEELVLGLGLKAEPDRLDLLSRLRCVIISQGKLVDANLEAKLSEVTVTLEHRQDHQRAAAEYHAKTGMADMDESFLPIYEQCKSYTMTSVERMYALFKAVQYLEDAGIDGDIVECGVWRGGSMMVAALTLAAFGNTNRNLYLFDTFEGLPRPQEDKDIDIWGNRAIDGWLPHRVGEEKSHWAEAGEAEVRANLHSTGYPATRIHFVKGMVERTIPDAAPHRIALLRLDTDWYASTKHELEHLFDRISPSGVLIIDDYGHFAGARSAVDEFISSRRIPILLNRIDYTGRIGIKVAR